MKRFESVEHYVESLEFWQAEVKLLRQVLQSSKLEEGLKWSLPCYMFQGKNVVGIGAFKSYFGLWFFDGAGLEDKQGVLINAQEGKTKALRQWRMSSAEAIKPALIKRYVREAVKLVEQGKTLKASRDKPVVVPAELQAMLDTNASLAQSFSKLSKACQREYAEYVAQAKRAETKHRRIEKIVPMILNAMGLNDHYRR